MNLQSLILPTDTEFPELYYRGAISLADTDIVSFDTYFNSFSYTKYRDYTNVEDVTFTCSINGDALVQLCVFDGEEHIICSTQRKGAVSLSIKLAKLPKNGFLYPKITALSDCTIIGGEYSAECDCRDISVCIAFCTFKREKYILKNIEQLKSSEFSFIDRVFVIDNGQTLDRNMLSDDFISVLPNKNYGGSGGFTRGLIEAYDGKYSHVILMDDDVEFHSETLEQMTVFMSLLSEQHKDSWFSAAMLPLDKPWEQFELGALWDGNVTSLKHMIDVRKPAVLLDNLDNPDVDYGGWWCLCMPVSVIDKEGLPLPLFIKFDDIEYGLRKPEGTEIITMNGIAVQHEAFDVKASFVVDYYSLRNELITIALHKKNGLFTALKRFIFDIGKHLTRFRYDNIPIIFRAVEQFLGGVDFFLACDEEQNNKDISAAAMKFVPLDTIPEYRGAKRCEDFPKSKAKKVLTALTFSGHIIPSLMLKKELIAIPAARAGASAMFRRRAIIQYQLSGDSGILLKRSFKKFLKYGFKTIGMTFKILFCYKKVKKGLISRKVELTSQEFWRKHLGID